MGSFVEGAHVDCVSETAASDMRAAYKVGFKDGATMIQEIQN